MKKITSTLLLLACLACVMVEAARIKQNLDGSKLKKLAQSKGGDHDDDPPEEPPGEGDICEPSLGDPQQGTLHALEYGSAASAGLREDTFEDFECEDKLCGEESAEGTEDFEITSCLCHKRKYCIDGAIDYIKNEHHHE
jgi:hypothetical protein